MKKYLIWFLVLGMLAAGFGYYQYNRTLENVGNLKTDIKIDATQLFKDFEEDESAANTKYLDKVMEVSGKITEVSQQTDGTKSISLASDHMMFGVIGALDPTIVNKNLVVKKGDQITLKGVCSGMLSDVVLVRCIIL